MPGEVSTIEYFAFDIKLVLRCIDILGRLVIALDQAGAKPYNFSCVVVYGKNDAVPVVVNKLLAAVYNESCFYQQFRIVLPGYSFACQCILLVGRIADTEFADDILTESSLLQIGKPGIFSFIRFQ